MCQCSHSQGRPPSAKGVMVVVVIIAGLLVGAGMGPPKAKASGNVLADLFGGGIRLPRVGDPAPSGRAARAVAYARQQVGDAYRYGAGGPNVWDCSSLMQAAWRAAGVRIPRTAAAQLASLPKVRGKLRAGDLLVYRTNGPSRRHVAIVAGAGRMVEARNSATGVVTSRIRGGYLGAVRPGGR